MNSKTEIIADENIACEECGKAGAMEMGGRFLCADCLFNCGSSCAGPATDENNC